MLLIHSTIVCLIRGTIYRRFLFSYILFKIVIGGKLVLFTSIYITRLASNEIFSPSNKIILTTLIILPAVSYITQTVANNTTTTSSNSSSSTATTNNDNTNNIFMF